MKAQLAILELLTRYELEEADNFEYRLKQVEKSFKTEWKDYDGTDKDLLTLSKLMFYEPGYRSNKKLKAMAEEYLKENVHNQNRIFNYDIWVTEKFKRRNN